VPTAAFQLLHRTIEFPYRRSPFHGVRTPYLSGNRPGPRHAARWGDHQVHGIQKRHSSIRWRDKPFDKCHGALGRRRIVSSNNDSGDTLRPSDDKDG
jgi:hypothetical protein